MNPFSVSFIHEGCGQVSAYLPEDITPSEVAQICTKLAAFEVWGAAMFCSIGDFPSFTYTCGSVAALSVYVGREVDDDWGELPELNQRFLNFKGATQ